jgi:hypothetical protein
MGVYLTPNEMKELNEKDAEGKNSSKLEIIKERLNIPPTVRLVVKPSGLNFTELRAMIGLRPKKYSELTTDQLLVKLFDEVAYVWPKVGYPTLVTPFSQYVKNKLHQAFEISCAYRY